MSEVIADQETIDWISVDSALPDAEETVLTNVPECGEPVWLGWFDEGVWYQIDGGEIAFPVVAWAKMPRGVLREGKRAVAV